MPRYVECNSTETVGKVSECLVKLPSPSRWLLRTIHLSYANQFAWHPLKFSGILLPQSEARMLLFFERNLYPFLLADVTAPYVLHPLD